MFFHCKVECYGKEQKLVADYYTLYKIKRFLRQDINLFNYLTKMTTF